MGGNARARKKESSGRPPDERPPTIPPPPTPELFALHPQWQASGPLPRHPLDLWRNACPAPTAAHEDKLASLAAEHDASTDGHGWYFVGRAILAGTDTHEQIKRPAYIRNTLLRWKTEDSYGSDKAPPAKKEPKTNGRVPDRPAVPAAAPYRPADCGPPPGLKIATVSSVTGRRRPAADPDSGEPPQLPDVRR